MYVFLKNSTANGGCLFLKDMIDLAANASVETDEGPLVC
jgi:hypothetical protein